MSDDERPTKMRKVESTNGEATAVAAPQSENAPQLPQDTTSKPTTEPEQAAQNTTDTPLEDSSEKSKFDPTKRNGPYIPLSAIAADPSTAGMSKSQLKKLRKKAEFAAGKDYRKQQKKLKEAKKKEIRQEERKAAIAAGLPPPPPVKKSVPKEGETLPVTLMLDCDFDSYMTEKEIMSLGQQVTRSYSDNRHGRYRAHIMVSSWGGRLRTRFETVLASHHLGWKGVTFTEKRFDEAAKDAHEVMVGEKGGRIAGALLPKVDQEKDEQRMDVEAAVADGDVEAPKEITGLERTAVAIPEVPAPLRVKPSEPQIVYLSSDSDQTLHTLSPYTTYVIGGIVDKNRHKGLCHKRAVELGIPTAKLPIGEYMVMQSRTVLATNHVVEIMVNYLESGSWEGAFLKAIPKRKEAVVKKNKEKQQKDGSEPAVEEEEKEVDDAADQEMEGAETEEQNVTTSSETAPAPAVE
jgi:tRNA (guanine9-N1)-methyltransferase